MKVLRFLWYGPAEQDGVDNFGKWLWRFLVFVYLPIQAICILGMLGVWRYFA
jgi:hypothetical protein